jgi:hypothetical protein
MLKDAFNMGVTKDPYSTFKTMSDVADQIAGPSNRAGRYIRQPSGYRAFIPASLPPVPPVRLEGELQFLLSDADRALGRLDGSIQTLPNPDLFVFMYVRKEAVLSSQIEGTQSSLQDLLAAEAKILSPDRPHRNRSAHSRLAGGPSCCGNCTARTRSC